MPKFKITAPRFIDGEYVAASPEFPAIIELPVAPAKDRLHEWKNLHEIEEEVAKPKPHYADRAPSHPQSAAEYAKGKSKRAADSEPV